MTTATVSDTAQAQANPGALTKALQDAQARRDKVTAELEAVRKSNDIGKLIAFLGTHKATANPDGTVTFPDVEREIAHAQRAVDQAEHARNQEKREIMRGRIYKILEQALATVHAEAAALGITGAGIIFADGKADITVREKSAVGSGTRGPRPGGTRASGKWQFNGQEYTSRELFQQFGLATASEKEVEQFNTSGGNWNAALLRTAKSMGWVDGGPRVLTHLPS